ncbi:MAG TPA: bifunctional phosphoribosylaminoimidazolecarboxamide formyltransferase/IMP cyclohydrolase [Salinisphaeraceae bacterium]|nr:bifunctional phosphoribosylaminoimidazolecarboxamide formyltransferase/IMP cyclohydrolase [Salinisphaeraceae bacterium]
MTDYAPIRRALISVSDKTGVVELARTLAAEFNVEILSTGGTARVLREAGIEVLEVAAYTGAPEIMGGRVKTLHPKIHGGILARRGVDDADMAAQGIAPIDLVVVNLYPFAKTIAAPDCDYTAAIENIDIGGPAMLRAAAKNHAFVTLLVDAGDYAGVLAEMRTNNGAVSPQQRQRLARAGFAHSAAYDCAISNYLAGIGAPTAAESALPEHYGSHYRKQQELRYGENPHQRAAVYANDETAIPDLVRAHQHQGKALSYNNLADADAALACIQAFTDVPACVIVKHANPCGVATGTDLASAYLRAFATDPVSAFGGILAFNRELDVAAARQILANQFAEIILAPSVSAAALQVLQEKKNLRVLTLGDWSRGHSRGFAIKPIAGGLLVQDPDTQLLAKDKLKVVTRAQPDNAQMRDLLFAWQVAKFVKSNAIVYARDNQTIGIGAGQMSRVDSARIAGLKAADAGLTVAGSVMASDAFFPFRDGLDTAAENGITAVIQPGGSIRDDEVIAAADEAGIAMLFTSMRHFHH